MTAVIDPLDSPTDDDLDSAQMSMNLRLVEDQIESIKHLLYEKATNLKFPSSLERPYQDFRIEQYNSADLKIILTGLFVYLTFGWADFEFGGDNAWVMFAIRCATAFMLASAAVVAPMTPLRQFEAPLVTAGIVVTYATVVFNAMLTEFPVMYFYLLGVIPVQVFAILMLRHSFLMLITASVVMLLSFTIFLANTQFPLEQTEIDVLAIATLPYLIALWVLLAVTGGYLSYFIEVDARRDYLKNRMLALEAERLQILGRRLKQLSRTDSLTQLVNRRQMEESLAEEWRRCKRSSQTIAVLMIDVDFFKAYNDGYGHHQGDQCLRSVAAIIKGRCRRAGDVCGRYGGEEFIVLLPNTELADAQKVAENIRTDIESADMDHQGSHYNVVTVSIGVAATIPSDDDNVEALVSRADQNLYVAKDESRNKVVAKS